MLFYEHHDQRCIDIHLYKQLGAEAEGEMRDGKSSNHYVHRNDSNVRNAGDYGPPHKLVKVRYKAYTEANAATEATTIEATDSHTSATNLLC